MAIARPHFAWFRKPRVQQSCVLSIPPSLWGGCSQNPFPWQPRGTRVPSLCMGVPAHTLSPQCEGQLAVFTFYYLIKSRDKQEVSKVTKRAWKQVPLSVRGHTWYSVLAKPKPRLDRDGKGEERKAVSAVSLSFSLAADFFYPFFPT